MRGEDLGMENDDAWEAGSPPHARGRQGNDMQAWSPVGITPACAGKTPLTCMAISSPGDHPRMRGEDLSRRFVFAGVVGSPPHARGRRSRGRGHLRVVVDHPRMRGEDNGRLADDARSAGSPPHARGRLYARLADCIAFWDHPRMRGEDHTAHHIPLKNTGSPPHARGRRFAQVQTAASNADHPRMRGEDKVCGVNVQSVRGSPPHARGRQLDSPGNTAKSFPSLPVFFCSQPSPLGWFLRWVLGLGSSLWKQR